MTDLDLATICNIEDEINAIVGAFCENADTKKCKIRFTNFGQRSFIIETSEFTFFEGRHKINKDWQWHLLDTWRIGDLGDMIEEMNEICNDICNDICKSE